MSDANLERITILLQARDRDFARAMDRNNKLIARMTRDAERDTQRMNRTVSGHLDQMGQGALTFGRNFASGFATAASAAALGFLANGLRQTVRGIAAVGDEARRAGLGVETFQEWQFVAEQNRIGIDQLVDGFKELNLRADEFIVTGAGPAAEAFNRMGYSAETLGRALEDPSELMLEIIGRMQGFDRAAQIRIADEVFGGSAGERFVELLSQGEAGLRRTIATAREVGAVMDESMIAAADRIDRRYNELAARLASLGRQSVVGWVYIFEDVAAALATDEVLPSVAALEDGYRALAEEARSSQHALMELAVLAQQMGNEQLAQALSGIAQQMVSVTDAFGRGEISAEALQSILGTLTGAAETAASAFGSIDNVTLDRAVSVVDGLRRNLVTLAEQAAITAAEVAAATLNPVTQAEHFWDTEEGRFGAGRNAPVTSPRPRRAPPMLGEPAPVRTPGGTAGSGAGQSGYAESVADIRARTAALEMEAAQLVAVAAAGRDYGDAVEFARVKAELLNQALADGRQITPELEAEIDALAEAYVTAGQNAEEAAARMERVREQSERGASALTDLFMAVGRGGDEARQAVMRLIAELIRVQMMRGLLGLGGGKGGGLLSMLGSMLSFEGGGNTGNAPRIGGVDGKGGRLAVLHPRETIIDHTKGQSAPAGATITINVTGARGNAEIEEMVTRGVAAGMRVADANLPVGMARVHRNPRFR